MVELGKAATAAHAAGNVRPFGPTARDQERSALLQRLKAIAQAAVRDDGSLRMEYASGVFRAQGTRGDPPSWDRVMAVHTLARAAAKLKTQQKKN